MRLGFAVGAVLACVLSIGARAEVLSVAGVYPAASDGAAALQSLSVERFGGEDGPALAIRIEDMLRSVELEGRPYFRVLAPGAAAEAVMRGTAAAEIQVQDYEGRRERCVQRDEKDKCVERKNVDVDCKRRRVELVPRLRLVARDGELLYSDDRPEQTEVSWCEGDDRPKSVESMVRELVDKVAKRMRTDLAPIHRSETFRVLEDRKGLSKEDGEKFRHALRLTKTDAQAACRQWDAIGAANSAHGATLFNLGLCAESAGDLADAQRIYRMAAEHSRASNIADGLRRIDARYRAERQLEAHSRR